MSCMSSEKGYVASQGKRDMLPVMGNVLCCMSE